MKNIIAVYKPIGPTSNDIVQQVKRITNINKVGHAGTLDPLASGVLVIGIGRDATKQLGSVVQKEKEYIASIHLGKNSTTDDEEGDKTEITIKKLPTRKKVETVVKQFQGEVKQNPPIFSAIKVKGKPAYKYARKGEALKLEPRRVLIKEINILEYKWPFLKIRVVTGPGVYIRSLARDIGEGLGVGGFLKELERTRVGDFTKEESITIERLSKGIQDDTNRHF